jgi:hypothetical protein
MASRCRLTIEETGRPLAIYPRCHRGLLWELDRPSPAEKDYLKGCRKSQRNDAM